jgi:RNA polymerase sigma-70 factor (ECF subfamily)
MGLKVHRKPQEKEGGPAVGALVARCQDGDMEAMEAIYMEYKAPLYNLAYRFLGNHAFAEDALQEIFLKIYKKIKALRSVDAFTGWAYRIAINICITNMRKLNRLNEEPLDDLQPIEDNKNNAGILKLDLDKAIHRLPDKQKLIFILHDLQGFSHPEIAGMMRLRTGTSKSQLFKARLKLRHYLKDGWQ